MRKIFFILGCLVASSSLYALYNGNPSAPNIIDEGIFSCEDQLIVFKAGYQGDIVFDRKLRARKGASGRMDRCEMGMNQGVITLNLLDRFEVYGSVGAMSAFLTHRPHVDFQRREYQTGDQLTWGTGARVVIVPFKNIDLGVEGGYQSAGPDVKWNAKDGVAYRTRAHFNYHEWQVGVGLSYHVDFLIPYFAVKYSNAQAKLSRIRPDILPNSSFKMNSREHFGLALGCTLSNAKIFDLTAEVRLFDEQAITLAGNLKF